MLAHAHGGFIFDKPGGRPCLELISSQPFCALTTDTSIPVSISVMDSALSLGALKTWAGRTVS